MTPRAKYLSKESPGIPHKLAWEWDSDAELEITRTLCLRSFWYYAQYGFGTMANPKGQKWLDEDIHKPLADWFQFHIEEWLGWRRQGLVQQKKLAVVVHREVGKTTLITQAGQSWLHLLDPEISTYTISEKLELAQKIVAPIKAVMDGSDQYSLWSTLFGNWCGNSRMWKASEVTHAARKNTARKDPSLGTSGVETSIVGAHPDAIFRDDPISYERLKTDTDWLGSVNDQTTSLIPVLQGDGLWVEVGTRYGSTDHFGTTLDVPEEGGEGIASVSGIPTDVFKVHPEGQWHVYFLAGRDQEGKPTTPKVWPEARLANYKIRSPIRYAAQVMNDPADSEYNPITRDQLKQCIIPEKQIPWSSLVVAICTDLALWDGRKRINKDETVYQVVGYPRNGSGDVYYLEGEGSMYWRDEDFAKRLVTTVQKYRNKRIRVIGITNDMPVSGLKNVWHTNLKNYFADANEPMPPHFELSRGSNAGNTKIQRISAATAFWVNGHVRCREDAPGLERLFSQMERIGEMQILAESGKRQRKKDDHVDTMADWFCPELYQSMRRPMAPESEPRASYVDPFGDQTSEADREWLRTTAREPVR